MVEVEFVLRACKTLVRESQPSRGREPAVEMSQTAGFRLRLGLPLLRLLEDLEHLVRRTDR